MNSTKKISENTCWRIWLFWVGRTSPRFQCTVQMIDRGSQRMAWRVGGWEIRAVEAKWGTQSYKKRREMGFFPKQGGGGAGPFPLPYFDCTALFVLPKRPKKNLGKIRPIGKNSHFIPSFLMDCVPYSDTFSSYWFERIPQIYLFRTDLFRDD